VVVAFTDRTEWSITLNSIPVAAVSLCAPDDGDLGDLESIAESGHFLLPETSHIRWSQIRQPPSVEAKMGGSGGESPRGTDGS
jgi:hypothetical protein